MTAAINNRNRPERRADGRPVGVRWERQRQKWRAQCHDFAGRKRHLGYFSNVEEAGAVVAEFRQAMIEADDAVAVAITAGQIAAPVKALPVGVVRRGRRFEARVGAGGRMVKLGTHYTVSAAAAAAREARHCRDCGTTDPASLKAAGLAGVAAAAFAGM